jgi:nucleotide-binding universal stress UspA family protein
MAAATGGRVTVLAVIALPPSILDLLPSLGVAEALDAAARDMTGEAVSVCEQAGARVDVQDRRLPFGSIGHEIARVAIEQACDLIAVGSRGRSGLGATLGSVAARVAAEAPCPVLVVPATAPGSG